MKFIGIIPARYASTRFPGKPLADMNGKPMIQRVYERVAPVLDGNVVVATDDERIYNAVTAFGGHVVMTSPLHRSGTDRCYEAYRLTASDADVVVNIQGDEPFIDPAQIHQLMKCFNEEGTQIATLVKRFAAEDGIAALENPNTPKVVLDNSNRAVYFSRSVIPYLRGVERDDWPSAFQYYTHIGLYAYTSAALAEIVKLPQSALEKAESLEQLRWISNGYTIRVAVTDTATVGIDTPADMAKALKLLESC